MNSKKMGKLKYPNDFINKIICEDTLKILPKIPDESVDLILTDPPYNINKAEWDDSQILPEDYIKELFRVLKTNSAIYVCWLCMDIPRMQVEIENYFDLRNLIVFHSRNQTSIPQAQCFTRTWEVIFYATKGTPKLSPRKNFERYGENAFDVWTIPKPQSNFKEGKYHPTQKPIKLIEKIIKASSNETDLILDPFLGSGTTAVVCKKLNRKFIGIEINPEYCKIAEERLRKVPKRLDKFVEVEKIVGVMA